MFVWRPCIISVPRLSARCFVLNWVSPFCRSDLLCQRCTLLRLAIWLAQVHRHSSAREGPDKETVFSSLYLLLGGGFAPHHHVRWHCNESQVSLAPLVWGESSELPGGAERWQGNRWQAENFGDQSHWDSSEVASVPGQCCRYCWTCQLWRYPAAEESWLHGVIPSSFFILYF